MYWAEDRKAGFAAGPAQTVYMFGAPSPPASSSNVIRRAARRARNTVLFRIRGARFSRYASPEATEQLCMSWQVSGVNHMKFEAVPGSARSARRALAFVPEGTTRAQRVPFVAMSP